MTHAARPADDIEVLQAATRLLAGIALRSVDILGGAITLPQYRVLAVLAGFGDARPARVAGALGLEASTVTRLVGRLAAAGHMTRSPDPANRSAVTLSLTAAGRKLVDQVAGWRRAELERLLAKLPSGERTALARTLANLVEVAGGNYGAITVRRLPI